MTDDESLRREVAREVQRVTTGHAWARGKEPSEFDYESAARILKIVRDRLRLVLR